jgi:hypothetical protein
MKRSVSFLILVAAVLLYTSSESSGGSCQDKLVGNYYDCSYAITSGQSGPSIGFITRHNCVEFITGGLSSNFDLVGSLGSSDGDLGCACQTTSDALFTPKLDISAKDFECVGDSVQFHGRIDSNRLHGQASEDNGTYIVFDCKKLSMACM